MNEKVKIKAELKMEAQIPRHWYSRFPKLFKKRLAVEKADIVQRLEADGNIILEETPTGFLIAHQIKEIT